MGFSLTNMLRLSSNVRIAHIACYWKFFLVHYRQVLCQYRLYRADHAYLTCLLPGTLNKYARCSSVVKCAAPEDGPLVSKHVVPLMLINNCWVDGRIGIYCLSLYLTNQASCHEELGRSGCIAPTFLTSELDGGEWSDSRPGRFTPGEIAPGTHWIRGWVTS
jgi:hypothetical protein